MPSYVQTAAAAAVRQACRCWARCSRARRWASACLSAGIILAIMIIPFIASVMRDVFEVTPPMLKESAYGLGCTTWEVVWKVVLPYTKTRRGRRHHARPGPRAGRDDGRHLRDR